MNLGRDIDVKLSRIEALLDKPTLDNTLRNELEEEMENVYSEHVALRSKHAYKNHISCYIAEEYQKRKSGEREKSLCSFDHECALQQGKTPSKIRTRGSGLVERRDTRSLLAEEVQEHPGAEVLHEARESFEKREGQLYRNISRIHGRLESATSVRRTSDA